MNRFRPIALAGIGTALLCNYWALEGLLAKRADFDSAWISDLAARSEAFGWRFELLAILAALAVVGFGLLLLPRLGGLSPAVRQGLLALIASGVLGVVAGAATLDCAEGLEASCKLDHGALDTAHALASVGEVLATALAFYLFGLGLQRREGRLTMWLGAAWLVLAVLTGLSFLSGDIDSIKGLAQRGDQVVFGVWLVALGGWAERAGHRTTLAPIRQVPNAGKNRG